MAKNQDAKKQITPANAYLAFAVALLVLSIIMIYQNTRISNAYKDLSANYTSLESQTNTHISELESQLSASEALVENITTKYDATEHNLTTPYTKVLFNNQEIIVPELSYNYTTGNNQGGVYNYSFYAPYPGYLVFNATSSVDNSYYNANWVVYFSQQKPYLSNGQLAFDRYLSTYSEAAPGQGITYIIPVRNGTNYMMIYSENFTLYSPIGIFLNMKYVGFHTS